MDIYEYLKMDHEQVNQLFKQFEKSDHLNRKMDIMLFIAQELLIHAKSEQQTFYTALKQYDESREDAVHGKKEHEDIETQINLILSTKKIDKNWCKKVEELKDIVTHHVKEEEGRIFRHAKDVLSEKEACRLKYQMHYLKQNLLRDLQVEMGIA